MSKASSLISLLLVLALALVVGGCGGSSGGKAKAPAARSGLVSIGAGLQGLPGLKATVYARGIPQMSAFAFDASGRLWVTRSGSDTHESDGVYVVASRGAKPVKVIPATLKGPLGVVWVGEKLYVSSLGRVTVFSGLSGHHFGRQTTVLTGPVPGGENNNLIRAPDGRLLMGISSTCDHCVPKSKWAAAIVSFRPDGSDLRIYARRIRAAYGLAFYPGTSDLFASMNQRDDLGAKTPGDWLAFVRQGDDWGFPACYGQGGAVCTNVPSPVGVLDTHAAAGSVAILTGQLGGRYRSSALVTEWEHGTVRRVTLKRTSTGYRGSVSTFLTGLQDPLPLATTADGSLLVGDWGRGIIYRIAVG